MKNPQKQECDNHPSKEENSNGIVFHFRRDVRVGSADTGAGDEEGRE
jgi:hypothetical protein